MKKVLILSGGYPNYGGEATTAYNLLKLLRNNNYDAQLVYINSIKNAPADPDGTNASHIIYQTKRHSRILAHNWIWNNIFQQRTQNRSKNIYIKLWMPKLSTYLKSIRFEPDIIIACHPVYHSPCQKLFPAKKILVIAGGNSQMTYYAYEDIDANYIINNPDFIKPVVDYDYASMEMVFNSQLNKELSKAMGIHSKNALVQYFNVTPKVDTALVTFQERKYGLAFISSHSRYVKNDDLAEELFNVFTLEQKLAIGEDSTNFSDIAFTETHKLITQTDILSYLANTKLLIITSYFDSSPGVLSEAILCGCNVLVSKNVGWHEVLDERCVVQDYNNKEEWIEKAKYLLENKIDYSAFEKIIAGSEEGIVNLIESRLT
ncbi:MAG: glycosyltransferase family 4 protein [Bacteroidetes bacterium]|nr:glycosyltransferase family 4 protein [Bacteroidota bacterium]